MLLLVSHRGKGGLESVAADMSAGKARLIARRQVRTRASNESNSAGAAMFRLVRHVR